VLCNDYKHPVVVATEIATLDMLSEGRVELGIGAGWMTADYEQAGLPMDSAGIRIERLAESLDILKGLFGDGPFSYTGKHYTITDLDGQPTPVQRPHPPIVIGGGGKKVLTLAGQQADIVGINANISRGYLDDALDALTAGQPDGRDGGMGSGRRRRSLPGDRAPGPRQLRPCG
jgi:alkanesulfonate monooxygenase SsuD/methylene tetrahydromethanopterin reductase-like flavin-dependent oxidoreductase (luciferase family)